MNSRDLLHQHVARQVRRFPELDHRPLEASGLSSRDATLVRAIDHAVTRHWLSLQAILVSQLDQPWDRLHAPVRGALLAGAAQLLYLDRVPDHAAINEAVNWVKSGKHPRARGVVNAVLRRLSRLRGELLPTCDVLAAIGRDRAIVPRSDGSAWRFTEGVFAEDSLAMVSQQCSVPRDLLERWAKEHDVVRARQLAAHCLVQPPIIVTGIDDASALSQEQLAPHDEPGFFVFQGDSAELETLLVAKPTARVQDPTAAAAVKVAQRIEREPNVVLDLCAGKGTKTRQLASQWPDARCIATDRDRQRQSVLEASLSNRPNVEVIDFKSVDALHGQVDLLLLDVPCSNTGVLARRVEAKYRFGSESLRSLVGVQRQLIADSIPLLAPGGHILYSTCSIESEENQQQHAWLKKWHDFQQIDERFTLPHGLPGEAGSAYRDGGFAVLLRGGA